MIMHVHHKSDLSEGSNEFAHFARIQNVLPGESRQFTDKTVHQHAFWRQFTDRIEDSSPTELKTVLRQIIYCHYVECPNFNHK